MKQQFKVIHVELETPYQGKRHYYYGSKAAIYQHLSEEIVGIKLESLWNVDLDQEEYKNRLCTIRMGTLMRKSTARGGVYKNTEQLMDAIENMAIPTHTLEQMDDWSKNGIKEWNRHIQQLKENKK